MEIEAAMGVDFCAVTVDDTIFRAGFGFDCDGFAKEIHVAVPLAGVGAGCYEDGIAI